MTMRPFARTEVYANGFALSAMKLWESLPAAIRLQRRQDLFKKALFDYLYDKENYA